MAKIEDTIKEMEEIHSLLIFMRDAVKLKGEFAFELSEYGFLGFANLINNIADKVENIIKRLYENIK